jgi:putative transposase
LQPAVDDTREGAYGRTDCELARQVEVGVGNGKSIVQARKEAEIVEQTYYRWRKEYGALKVNQARRSKELKQKHAKLKCLVSELSLEKQVLRDIASLTAASPSAALLCIRPR